MPLPLYETLGGVCAAVTVCSLYRAKYLRRKYFTKWSGRVFGRVLPSVARQRSAQHAKRKMFTAWQEVWWVEHKEWKLGIRAECHNR